MENRPFEELSAEFLKIANKGDEQETKRFLAENIKEFPEDIQGQIITLLVEDALTKQKNDAEAVAAFQKEGLETWKGLGALKEKLENKDKLLEIKESL